MGDLYLNIVESRKEEDGAFERQSLIVFDEDKESFLRGLDDALKLLNQESDKRRNAKNARSEDETPTF